MGVDERDFRRATEDVHAVPVGKGVGYAWTSSGAVCYREIVRGQRVLGYLWYSDAEDAAGYVARVAEGDDALDAGNYWYGRLIEAQRRGLPPSAAVAEFEAEPAGGHAAGCLAPGSAAEAESTQALKEDAGHTASGTRPVRRGERRGQDSDS